MEDVVCYGAELSRVCLELSESWIFVNCRGLRLRPCLPITKTCIIQTSSYNYCRVPIKVHRCFKERIHFISFCIIENATRHMLQTFFCARKKGIEVTCACAEGSLCLTMHRRWKWRKGCTIRALYNDAFAILCLLSFYMFPSIFLAGCLFYCFFLFNHNRSLPPGRSWGLIRGWGWFQSKTFIMGGGRVLNGV